MIEILDKKARELGFISFTNLVVDQEWDAIEKCIEYYAQSKSSSPAPALTESDLSLLKRVRDYFLEHDKTRLNTWLMRFSEV